MLVTCKCGKEFLTEADPYVLIPQVGKKDSELNCGCYVIEQYNKEMQDYVGEDKDFTEKGEWEFEVHEHVGYMKSIKGCDDYCMFVNENFQFGEGGFSWDFLDFKPLKNPENYKPIYIYRHSVASIIKNYQRDLVEYKRQLDFIKSMGLEKQYMESQGRLTEYLDSKEQ